MKRIYDASVIVMVGLGRTVAVGVAVAVSVGTIAVGVGIGCDVSVGAAVDCTVVVGPTVGVETPVAGTNDFKGVYSASNRVNAISKTIECLNHNCAPSRKVAFLPFHSTS